MKNRFFLLSTIVFILFAFVSCDKTTDDAEDTLYVKFINDASSEFTILSIELRSRGISNELNQPIGEWGSNILSAGQTLAPGASTFFTLDIPNLNWSEYRIRVNDGNGNSILVEINENAGVDSPPQITHWGSMDRTVSVIVKYNATYNLYYINGWSDYAGLYK
ncbi:MAG TPA: hypothetical protein DCG69_10320 [Bacteroidales bacterium]|nr:hypothetical protein [Bacteroidales bacterium]